MVEPVNFNRFKKQKVRAEKKARADENSVKFGLTKSQKTNNSLSAAKIKKDLDGHKSET